MTFETTRSRRTSYSYITEASCVKAFLVTAADITLLTGCDEADSDTPVAAVKSVTFKLQSRPL